LLIDLLFICSSHLIVFGNPQKNTIKFSNACFYRVKVQVIIFFGGILQVLFGALESNQIVAIEWINIVGTGYVRTITKVNT